MAGLVVGLLERHLEQAGELMDVWLANPEIWHLESVRVTHEGAFHVRGQERPDSTGSDKRGLTMRDVASFMTVKAAVAGDERRLAVLATLGEALVEAARSALGDSDNAADLLVGVAGWAATFDPSQLPSSARREWSRAHAVRASRADRLLRSLPSATDLSATSEALRLLNTYAAADDRAASVDTLIDDLHLARRMAEAATGDAFFRDDSVAAVTAAAVVASARGLLAVDPDDLRWCTTVLLAATAGPPADVMLYHGSVHPRGADRSAAAATPLLLMTKFDDIDLNVDDLGHALSRCASSLFDEVRVQFALSAMPVWSTPCTAESWASCRHGSLWQAVNDGLRDVQLGRWNNRTQRREIVPLEPPFGSALDAAATGDLLLNRLYPPLIAVIAARAAACVRTEAEALLDVLHDAHLRVTAHWAREDYGSHNGFEIRRRRLAVRSLVDLAVEGDLRPLAEHARVFAENARALHAFFDDLATIFTYDDDLHHLLEPVWRSTLSSVLDAVDAGVNLWADRSWSDYAIASLLPVPHPEMSDLDMSATLEHARTRWVAPEALTDLVARWIPLAVGEPKAADAIAGFAQTASRDWQADHGLNWAEQLVDSRYDRFANRCWSLPDWLGSVREQLEAHPAAAARWHRLVDGLAAHGDRSCAELQRLEE